PNAPTDITCTITNTARPAQVTLSKNWVNGAAGDTAGLTITNVADPADSDSAIATVPAGRGVRSTSSARLTLTPGETVTLAGTRLAVTRTRTGTYAATYRPCLGCAVGVSAEAAGAFTAIAAPFAAGVTCMFSNTRQRATVVLQKHWNNGALNVVADLSIT